MAATVRFEAIARLDGPIEVDYYRGGGILPAVLRRLARATRRPDRRAPTPPSSSQPRASKRRSPRGRTEGFTAEEVVAVSTVVTRRVRDRVTPPTDDPSASGR